MDEVTVVKSVRCGFGRFELLSNETIYQYDNQGRLVGATPSEFVPDLRKWITTIPINLGGRPTLPEDRRTSAPRFKL